jgi:hypothetical protein
VSGHPERVTPVAPLCDLTVFAPNPDLVEVELGSILLVRPTCRWLCVPGCGDLHQIPVSVEHAEAYRAAGIRVYRSRQAEERDALIEQEPGR